MAQTNNTQRGLALHRSDSARVAAAQLDEARSSGVPCRPVRDLLPDVSLSAGYRVQELLTRMRLQSGRRIVGRKVGLTSPNVQAQLGVDEPDFGVLFNDMQCEQDQPIDSRRLLQPRIEAELAFILAADLDGDVDIAAARAAVSGAVAALEIVDSRIANWDITLVDTVADNASAGLFVLGRDPSPLGERDLRQMTMSMTCDTSVVSHGTGADCLGDPVAALAWLARTAYDHDAPLRAGEIVLTGALGPMVPARAGHTYTAHLSSFGTVSATFEDAETGR